MLVPGVVLLLFTHRRKLFFTFKSVARQMSRMVLLKWKRVVRDHQVSSHVCVTNLVSSLARSKPSFQVSF